MFGHTRITRAVAYTAICLAAVGALWSAYLGCDHVRVAIIAKKLSSADEAVAGRAMAKLRGCRTATVVDCLISAYPDSKFDGQTRIVDILVEIGAPAVGDLVGCVNDLGSTPSAPTPDVDASRRFEKADCAVLALGRLGEPAVGPLIETLAEGGTSSRTYAAFILGQIGDAAAVPALSKAASDPAKDVRIAAIKALGAIGGDAAVEALRVAFSSGDTVARERAAFALGRCDRPHAVEYLVVALRSKDATLRGRAAIELGNLGDPAAFTALVAAMEEAGDGNEAHWSRMMAAKALGRIGDTRAVEPLIRQYRNAKGNVTILVALEYIGTPQARQEVDQALKELEWAQVALAKVPGCVDISQVARNYGAFLVNVKDPGTRILLSLALAGYGDLPMAKDFLNSGSWELAVGAAYWVTRRGIRKELGEAFETSAWKAFIDDPTTAPLPSGKTRSAD